ncbi:MAG: MFS transporter [Actinobacteria bacterium]|nr:MFS transporter [Actinomycetota bacterium]
MTATVERPDAAEPQDARLGSNYRKLWTASFISNLGDGIDAAALPLLAAALTRDPALFAGVAVAGRLPWLVFALQAGAIADRVDRRRLMATANVVRFGLMGVLGLAILGDWASIWLLYVVAFCLGIAETLFDNAAQAIMPSVVVRPQLERANGRLYAGEMVANQFLGPPLGGFLFAVAAAVPILLDAGTFLVAAGLIAWMTGSYASRRPAAASAGPGVVADPDPTAPARDDDVAPGASVPRRRMRTEIAEGLRWLWGHRLLRTLAILLGFMNGLSMMFFATFALFATDPDILGLGEIGFGFLLTAGAAGSVLASLVAGRIVERFGRGPVLWSTLLGSVAIPIATGASSDAFVVGALSAGFGFTAVIWNVVTVSLRQTIIPDDLLGRVNSVYRFVGWGSMPVGAFLGGVIASQFGLRAPWFVAGTVMALALVPAVRVISSRTIEEARAAAGA